MRTLKLKTAEYTFKCKKNVLTGLVLISVMGMNTVPMVKMKIGNFVMIKSLFRREKVENFTLIWSILMLKNLLIVEVKKGMSEQIL